MSWFLFLYEKLRLPKPKIVQSSCSQPVMAKFETPDAFHSMLSIFFSLLLLLAFFGDDLFKLASLSL